MAHTLTITVASLPVVLQSAHDALIEETRAVFPELKIEPEFISGAASEVEAAFKMLRNWAEAHNPTAKMARQLANVVIDVRRRAQAHPTRAAKSLLNAAAISAGKAKKEAWGIPDRKWFSDFESYQDAMIASVDPDNQMIACEFDPRCFEHVDSND